MSINLILQVANHFGLSPKPLVPGAIPTFCPRAVADLSRATAAMWAGISDQESIQTLKFSELPRYVFGERNALTRLLALMPVLLRSGNSGRALRHETVNREQGVNMYATKAINGIPAIHRDGQSVLSVCDQDWEFADWLCALLNELGHMPELSLTDQRKVQHA